MLKHFRNDYNISLYKISVFFFFVFFLFFFIAVANAFLLLWQLKIFINLQWEKLKLAFIAMSFFDKRFTKMFL